MIYELDEVKKMFIDADNLIKERPELLLMHIDQIFDELDENPEMRHVRWGVMTRVKMVEIKEYSNRNILDFMTSIKEHNLLCEYIGYVLQTEYHISLNKLLIEAYENNMHKEILPFVEPCLEYEEDCLIDKIDIMLDIIGLLEDGQKTSLVYGYGSVILKTNNEGVVFEKYIKNYSESLECLVGYLINELYPRKAKIAKKWFDRYMNEEQPHCKRVGICLLHRSLIYDTTIFENYFCVLEELCDNQEYWEKLIGVYIRYNECANNTLYKNKVKERLIKIKNGSLKEKRIFIQEINSRIKELKEYSEIIESILGNSFNKDRQILKAADYYFDYLLDEDIVKAVAVLYKVYEVNEYSKGDEFWGYLPRVCTKLRYNQEGLLEIWWNKFLYGSKSAFFLSVEMFKRILALEKLEEFLNKIEVSQEDALCLLEGIVLFTIEENDIVHLAFIVSTYIENNEFFVNYCIDNIFVNYPGALVDEAKQYIDSENIYKKALAEYIIEYYNRCKEKIRKGYENKDFVPPIDRKVVYQKNMEEENRRVLEKANEQSMFANLFPARKMKYGKRIAFLQTYKKEQYNYNVNEYAKKTYSKELPKYFMNNPMKYVYMKMDYLRRRGKNAINS